MSKKLAVSASNFMPPVWRAFFPFFLLNSLVSTASGESFYREPDGIFSTRPDEKKSLQNIKRFGPVGIGIDLLQPAFVMRISNVEEGSPAETAGLEKGRIIETINGEELADIDPRIQLAGILGKAEATDGLLAFKLQDISEPVTVKVPVLGAYSETWPLNCPKSERIIRNFADSLSRPGADKGFAGIGMLFLLSTGEEKDLAVAREWARNVKASKYAWHIGYGGIPLCECYLRTGDEKILANIQEWVRNAVEGQYLDAWAGRGGVPRVTYGNGHLNAGGTAVLTFLLLAKECGADVPDHALLGALTHFFRYAGRGGNPYGDDRPEVGFVDNGKQGNLAFAMAAAASLTPEGEDSIYAAARDVCAMPSFYTTSFMLHGHTGGGIGEIWRSAAMSFLHESKPAQYRDFMDQRRWHYDLSRRFDGSFAILGGAGYDKEEWGSGYALAYTMPRKTLRITGAPPTRFSQKYQLPKQPWGNEADDLFLSLEGVPYEDGTTPDLSGEILARDSSKQVLTRLHGSEPVSDEILRHYLHHQDHNLRFVAANKVLGIDSGYIGWRKPGGEVRKALLKECLHHQDPRVRRAIFAALAETFAREKRLELLTSEVFALAIKAITSPDESLWVKDAALHVIAHATADQVIPHLDEILPYLKHDDWWLQNAALKAITPVIADERSFRKVLPPVGELIRTNQRSALTLGLMGSLRQKIKEAGPEVQELAAATLKESFTGYDGKQKAEGGQDISSTYDAHLEFIAASLADVPGGLDVLYEVATERYPNEILPYKEFFLAADSDQFGPRLRNAIAPIIKNELIPEFVGRNRTRLLALANAEVQSAYPGGSSDVIDGLASLHARAGDPDYDWHLFLDLRNAEWSYHSFDPIPAEQVPFDQLISRYRPVTLPEGTENWFQPDFQDQDWKRGKSPFGHFMGRLPTGPVHKCSHDCDGTNGKCHGGIKINSFWEKEVLLMRGTFKVPPLKDGHRYRIRVNDGEHVGSGGGHIIYLNGKPLIETPTCGGRGSGGRPKGAYITKEFLDDLKSGTITVAAQTFLRYNDKYKVKPTSKVPQGKFSLHLEEQKIPPITEGLVRKSAELIPMLSWEWQKLQNAETEEIDPEEGLFRWDGRSRSNEAIQGSWKVVGEVTEIEEFDSSQRPRPARRPLFSQIDLKPDGITNSPVWIWSGDILMDLTKFQALRMVEKTIDETDFLFIERGGFSNRQKQDWNPGWYVLARP